MERNFYDTEYHALFYKDGVDGYVDELFYNDSCETIDKAVERVYDNYAENKDKFDYAEVEVQVTEYEKDEDGDYTPLDTVSNQVLFTFRDGKLTGFNY